MNRDTNQSTTSLSNKTILITRPTGREGNLRRLIEHAGGNIIHYPVISITPPPLKKIESLKRFNNKLPDYNIAIFISPTAVDQSHLYFPVLPKHLTIASIGSKTSDALAGKDLTVNIEAPDHDTESLLTLKAFQLPDIREQKIIIFRGTGGRALLGDTLKQRGAHVQYVETYQRKVSNLSPLNKQQLETLDAIVINSQESLRNLLTLASDTHAILDIPITVPNQRAYELAHQFNFKTIITAENATDEAAIDILLSYF